MELVPGRVRKLWNDWDLRTFVLLSLLLQTILVFTGRLRKRNSSKWVNPILWSSYLLADWVAVFALGILSNSSSSDQTRSDNLLAFWAPFLLLHLGGPDTITAFSLEDNELWLRHLLGLLFQLAVAVYVFIRSLPDTTLLAPELLMFLAGTVKYGERTYSLKRASTDSLRNSMITAPDPGPNYAKFMDEYSSHANAKLPAEIIVEKEPDKYDPLDTSEEKITNSITLISRAHHFFLIFKRLIVDLILTFHDRNESRSFFLKREPLQAFELVEIELSFVYEALFTKSSVIYTDAGPFLRCLSFISILFSFFLFIFTKKHGYNATDIAITYVLLAGALAMECSAFIMLLFSDYGFIRLKNWKFLSNEMYDGIKESNKWSNSIAQHNLISLCLKAHRKSQVKRAISILGVEELWNTFWHTHCVPVPDKLKKFIFNELKRKSISAEDSTGFKRFGSCRGEWALQKEGYRKELGWSVALEFDESILLWHIATDLCYNTTTNVPTDFCYDDTNTITVPDLCGMSKLISDYMLYILVARPSMLTAGIGQIRYGDTCAEAKEFFQRGDEEIVDTKKASEMLLLVETKVPPVQVKGDRSKSVLFDACMLAKSLLELKEGTRWKIVASVWVEMLGFAASHCRGYLHAKQLSAGGELLTVVWFLMAHLGIGEQYRVEAGHARAKLIIGK